MRGMVAGSQEITIIMMASMVAASRADVGPGGGPEAAFLAALTVTTLAIGVSCWLAAKLALGRLAHFIPWPVVAGLLAGSGLALMRAALPILTGKALEDMLKTDPVLASRFHRHVVATLAERLVDNGRQIRMLSG